MAGGTWVFQKPEHVRDLGEENAPYYVGWYEPDGRRRSKSCGNGFRGKKTAEKLANKLRAELMTGTYQMNSKKLWSEFREEYDRRILSGRAEQTRRKTLTALDHFARIVKPIRIFAINTGHVDDFIAARRTESGKKEGDKVSPFTVNRDLRHLRAAFRVAVEWGYLKSAPRFRMEPTLKRLPSYVAGDHFAAIYAKADTATMPEHIPYSPAEWWRGLITMAYMTGWRIGDILKLRRDQVDLEAGTAISLAEDNKGKRDDRVKLHSVVVEHLRQLPGFSPVVFPWDRHIRTLYSVFARFQEAAGIKLPCTKGHKHTRYCHLYGFHDFRRAFATMNADKLTPDALQALMRHKSYQTTQVYINMARQMDEAVDALHVPDVLKIKKAAGE
jgi:integrase